MKGAISIISLLLLAGCGGQKSVQPDDHLVVFTSIPPQTGLLRKIVQGRENLEIRTLVGEGQSPHAYEPTARQLAKLGEAGVLFTIGVPFEKQLLAKIEPLYPKLPIVATQTGIELRTMPHEHHGETCTHEHGAKDPHVWLSPANARIIAENMFNAMARMDPGHRNLYAANFEKLARDLTAIDDRSSVVFEPHRGSRFYVFHPSFGYFADAYGLEQVPVEIGGKSPSSRQLAGLIEQARADGVRVVFVQKQFPVSSAKAVAEAIGGEVIQLDPLAEDVVANLRQIAEAVSNALQP